jgi:intein/homing endonuclease
MLKSFRGDTIIYTKNGTSRIDNLSVNDLLLDDNGDYVKILNISKDNLKAKMYKIKLHINSDNIFLTKKCKILAIQDVPCDLKNNDVKNYIYNETRNSRPKYININDLTDFDYVGYPIPRFSDENHGNPPEYYRFFGLVVNSGFSNNFLLDINKNKDTLGFIKDYLTSKDVSYDEKYKDTQVLISYPQDAFKITKFNYEYNNLNKESSIALLKGLLELNIKDNNILSKPFIYYKTNYKIYTYIFKFLLIKLGVLPSVFHYKDLHDNNISYYIIKIPFNSIIKNILYSSDIDVNNIDNDDKDIITDDAVDKGGANDDNDGNDVNDANKDDKYNYFIYNDIIWTKVKSINIVPYNGIVYSLTTDRNIYTTDVGVINNIDNIIG